ncbi:MAG: hypothetical protein FJZ56_05600 [Chlamydiae bacterium]|nr:hypothetical protein [Chlamydiota bacterium]
MTLKDLPPFFPADFFEMEIPVKRQKKLTELPDFSLLLAEIAFASCKVGIHEGALKVSFDVRYPAIESFYPSFNKGDAIELMIDTRNIKNCSVMHKYGHHFVFLPKEVEGERVHEITKFHGDDKRPYVEISSIDVDLALSSKSYKMDITFREGSLFGFDPLECQKIGFSYKIHKMGGACMHFNVSSKYWKIEKSPSLWATLRFE